MSTERECCACRRTVAVRMVGKWPTFAKHIEDISQPTGSRHWCVNSDVAVAEALVPTGDGTYRSASYPPTGGTLGATPARHQRKEKP